MNYYIYLLKSLKNNKIYVGYTSKSPKERLTQHNFGSNQWTRANKPFKLLYYEKFYCKTDAQRRETFLKSGVGNKLVKIIAKYYKPGL